MNVQHTEKQAYLSTDFGEKLAKTYKVYDLAEEKLGRFTRGKRKGKIRGSIEWLKCERGGWKTGVGVCRPGVIAFRLCSPSGEVVHGQFKKGTHAEGWTYAHKFISGH